MTSKQTDAALEASAAELGLHGTKMADLEAEAAACRPSSAAEASRAASVCFEVMGAILRGCAPRCSASKMLWAGAAHENSCVHSLPLQLLARKLPLL